LLDLLFPAQCASCNALGSGLCEACVPSDGVIHMRLPTLAVTACGAYEKSLRAAVLALKDGRRDVAQALAQLVSPLVAPGALLVPVPTTAARRRIRGIDGVAAVARIAAELRGARVVGALTCRSGSAQRGRSRAQRLAASGRFACEPGGVDARRVTLFDDVCTTGSTLRDCADAVRRCGGFVENAVVVAVTKSHPPWREPIPS
jgi:predicted amidophosphoribosyltransferase